MNSQTVSFSRSKKRLRRSLIAERHLGDMALLLLAIEGQRYELSEHRLRIVHGLCALEYIENAEELWMLLNNKRKISRAVVYSCLSILSRSGVLTKMQNEKGGASYRLNKNKLN